MMRSVRGFKKTLLVAPPDLMNDLDWIVNEESHDSRSGLIRVVLKEYVERYKLRRASRQRLLTFGIPEA
jgi:metal-responsive CopG/Arc/MetJ family transcriptional regulator